MITTGFAGFPPYSKPSYSSVSGVRGAEAAGTLAHDDHRLNMDRPSPARTLATRQATYWSRVRGGQWRKARRRATVREICNHNCDFEARTHLTPSK
jgi:Phosphoribosyl-AMP cyclohydrolase